MKIEFGAEYWRNNFNYVYRSGESISELTRHIFVEGSNSHAFLYKKYGSLENIHLIKFDINFWDENTQIFPYIENSITSSIQSIFFLTLDSLVYGPNFNDFIVFLKKSSLKIRGILHRPPNNDMQLLNLIEANTYLSDVVVLSNKITLGDIKSTYLPLHATHSDNFSYDKTRLRAKYGVPDGKKIFSIVGDAREGKGIDLVLQSLMYLKYEIKEKIFILIAGRANNYKESELLKIMKDGAISAHIDLRNFNDSEKYSVLSDEEFSDYINISDVGILCYQGDQRLCMSGTLPNYIQNNCQIIANKNSIIGQILFDHNFGLLLETEDPIELASKISIIAQQKIINYNSNLHIKKIFNSDQALITLNNLINN